MPVTVPFALCISTHLNFIITWWNRYYYPQFISKETEDKEAKWLGQDRGKSFAGASCNPGSSGPELTLFSPVLPQWNTSRSSSHAASLLQLFCSPQWDMLSLLLPETCKLTALPFLLSRKAACAHGSSSITNTNFLGGRGRELSIFAPIAVLCS